MNLNPKIIIIRGNSGSGETTIAGNLQRYYGRGMQLISQGMVPHPRARIFLADKKEFDLAKDLIDGITENMDEKDINIDNICSYLENK
jgi:cytidylate kinase